MKPLVCGKEVARQEARKGPSYVQESSPMRLARRARPSSIDFPDDTKPAGLERQGEIHP